MSVKPSVRCGDRKDKEPRQRASVRVFVGMETSGQLRRRFHSAGFDCVSCDLLPADDGAETGRHIQGDVFEVLEWLRLSGWWPDLAIFHPDCTYLTNSAAWAYKDADFIKYPGVGYHQKIKPETLTGADRREARTKAVGDWRRIDALPIKRKVAENPAKGALSSMFRKPDQVVHPWQFGDDASKETGFWLWDLMPLELHPRLFVPPRYINGLPRWGNQTDSGQNRISPSADRWKDRSKTFDGIADAMVRDWGRVCATA